MTPFQALYGYEPPNWKELVLNDTNVPEVRNQLEKSQKTIELLKDNLVMAQTVSGNKWIKQNGKRI